MTKGLIKDDVLNQQRGKTMVILSQEKIGTYKDCIVWLQRIQDSSPPDYAKWCVQFAGNGHYFRKYDEAIDYMRKRKFLNNKQIQMLLKKELSADEKK